MNGLVLNFDDVGRGHIELVGGKGANLGEMVTAGMPVPPGFCVTTVAYDRFLNEAQKSRPLLSALLIEVEELGAQDVPGVRRVAGAIRNELEQANVDDEVVASVRSALEGIERLNPQDAREPSVAYAVRSSATLEDLEDASFAGQQDTYLQVVGIDAVIDRMRACWASLFTDRAVLYRRMHGYRSRDAKLSVVVQKMARPEISGILFTADPLTGHRGRCSVDASWGLGEALVSGLVNADLYQLDKATGRALSVHIGDKAIAIEPNEDGRGTKTVELGADKRSARVLDDKSLLALAQLGRNVEAHYGGSHQDIEFAFERRGENLELVLLQARPITSLFPLPEGASNRQQLSVFASFNHVQNMMDPMSPFGVSVIRYAIPFGKSEFVEASSLVVPAGHHLYMDLSPAMRTFPFSKLLTRSLSAMDSTMAAILQNVAARPAFKTRDDTRRVRKAWVIKNILFPVFRRLVKNFLRRDLHAVRAEFIAQMEGGITDARAAIASEETLLGRMRAARRIFGSVFEILIPVFPPAVGAGGLSWRLLTKMCHGQIPAEEVQQLTRGFEGNVTTQMDLELGDIADVIRENSKLGIVFREMKLDGLEAFTILDALRSIEGAAAFFKPWDTFIERYGHRCPGEIDAARTRWREDPTSLLVSLKGMLASDTIGKHRVQEAASRAQAEAMGERIVTTLGRGVFGSIRGRLARRLVNNVRTYLALREHGKYFALKLIDLGRTVVLEVGQQLADQQQIDDARDAFYFSVDELIELLEHEERPARLLVEQRKASMERAKTRVPPRVLTSDGEAPPPPPRTDLPPGALGGIAASAGTVEGIAKVVMDPTTEVLVDGEILVAPFTDPGWTPLFVHAAGLVMEVGGLMTHGSVVAREYGIPAVVGVDGATSQIKTGDHIMVDGTSGIVTFADDERALTPENR